MRLFFQKAVALLMVFALILMGGCSQQSEQDRQPEKTLYEHGLEVISLMKEMASTEEYIDFLSASEDLKSILLKAGKGDFSKPKAVYRIRISEASFLSLAEVNLDGLPQSLQENLTSRVTSAVFTQINAMGGAEILAASSVCTAGKTFVSSELAENEIYLYTYDNAVPAAVAFSKGEDSTVSATGTFVLYDGFQADSLPAFKDLLAGFGAEIEEISP